MGVIVGSAVGCNVGDGDGCIEGATVGIAVVTLGSWVGTKVGAADGDVVCWVGEALGAIVGVFVGALHNSHNAGHTTLTAAVQEASATRAAQAVGSVIPLHVEVGAAVGADEGACVEAVGAVGAVVGDAVHNVSNVAPVAVKTKSSPLPVADTWTVKDVLPLATLAANPERLTDESSASGRKHTSTIIDPEYLTMTSSAKQSVMMHV